MPTQPAILGSMRLGNFRLGYEPAALVPIRRAYVRILLAGVAVRTRVRVAGFTIHDAINDAPNTCSFVMEGSPAPVPGQRLHVWATSDDPHVLFTGTLQTVDLTYEGLPGQVAYACTAIDDLADLNRRRPFGTWTLVSATTVAQALISAYAPGFSAAGIDAGLPLVSVNFDGSEGFSGALRQLAKLIGGYFTVEDRVVYLFTEDTSDPPAAIDDTPGRFLDEPPITRRTDDSQLQTRVYGKGHGEATPWAVPVGATSVPIASASMFNPAGGQAISDTQIFGYTGVQLGGVVTTSGGDPNPTPSTPSVAEPTPRVTGALAPGNYVYKVTFGTSTGQSGAGSGVNGTVSAVAAAGGAGAAVRAGGAMALGTYTYAFTLVTANGETASLGSTNVTLAGGNQSVTVTGLTYGDARILKTNLYRSKVGTGAPLYLVGSVTAGGAYIDNTPDTSLGGEVLPTVDTAQGGALVLTAIPLAGDARVTSRRIYRTKVGGSVYFLVGTIGDNTTTTWTDTQPDTALGEAAPTVSSIAIAAGSTTLPLVSTAGVPASGWLTSGLRYTGVSGNTLVGIPASGVGSLSAPLAFGSVVETAPALTGVTGIGVALVKGAPVHIWVQRDDLPAQAAQAIIDTANGRVPADGIYEGPPIVDERRGEASLTALCDATLALFSRPIQTVTYACRDLDTKSGKPVHFAVTTPPIGPVDLTIQDVTIDQIDVAPGTAPRFSVTASSVRFSLEDLLRRMAAATGA